MLNVSIISMRESIEMLMVVIALATYAEKINKRELLKFIYGGAISGFGVSLVSSIILYNQTKFLEGYAKDLFNGTLMIFLSILVIYYIVWMKRQKKTFNMDIGDKYNISMTGFGMFVFSFLTVFRETLEIVMFIIPMLGGSKLLIIAGVLLGFTAALIINLLLFKSSLKLNLSVLFDIISFIMIYIGAEMFGEGLSLVIQNGGEQIEKVGMLAYGLPVLYLFLKALIKDYIRKNV
jgi:high-affinity iron transporter